MGHCKFKAEREGGRKGERSTLHTYTHAYINIEREYIESLCARVYACNIRVQVQGWTCGSL